MFQRDTYTDNFKSHLDQDSEKNRIKPSFKTCCASVIPFFHRKGMTWVHIFYLLDPLWREVV